MEEALIRWCQEQAQNGIAQHSEAWLKAKQSKVGGSAIATIMGISAFTTLREYIETKLGLRFFKSDIKPQWGNLFEDVIKRQVESAYGCTVHGEDLFIVGQYPGTVYSPDGLGVVGDKCVLFEFKCPYSRIPAKAPPKYYVPQVKMGLEIIPLAEYGIYVEAVYRRCTWADLGPSAEFDTTLVQKPTKCDRPISYGFIGLWADDRQIQQTRDDLADGKFGYETESEEEYNDSVPDHGNPLCIPGFCDEFGTFASQMYDLSQATPALFRNIMKAVDSGRLTPFYGSIISETDTAKANAAINADMARYRAILAASHGCNYGVLSWKLLQIKHHRIEREPGFLEPYLEKIRKITEFVSYHHEKNTSMLERAAALEIFMQEYYGGDTGSALHADEYVDCTG